MASITMTVKQAVEFTNLSHTTIYALIKEGRLSKIKIGRRTLLQRNELIELVTPAQAVIMAKHQSSIADNTVRRPPECNDTTVVTGGQS